MELISPFSHLEIVASETPTFAATYFVVMCKFSRFSLIICPTFDMFHAPPYDMLGLSFISHTLNVLS